VVVPLSTIEHWRREFEGWTNVVCCVYHDRQRIWRDVMREYEWYYEDRPHSPEFLKFDVLVTTYDTLISDFDVISQIPFRVSVVDEAHRLRNQKGKLLECMREVSARGTLQYGFQSRVLMSGTPLQNDLTVSVGMIRIFDLLRLTHLYWTTGALDIVKFYRAVQVPGFGKLSSQIRQYG
jgi:SNF2 family DNA or RNA helicase